MVESKIMEPNKERGMRAVENFIKENRVDANNSGAACPDGRYTQAQDSGWVRMFGAHLGICMAVMASLREKGTDVSPKKIFADTKEALSEIIGKEVKIQAHTDDHKRIGCGHVDKAASGEYEDLYGIKAQDALSLWEEAEKDGQVNWITLLGKHNEKGVLLVHGKDYSVHSQNNAGNEMYFVVDVDRTNELLTRVSEKLDIEGVSGEDIVKEYWKQVNATSGLLAKGLPQFDVKFDNQGNFTSEYLGDVK